MALEAATHINDLVVTNPPGSDNLSTADDHLRLIKDVLKRDLPLTGAVTATYQEINGLNGLTASRAIATTAGGILTASATTAAELAYVNGVTSAIQTQLDAKQPLDSDLTAIAALSPTADNFIVGSGSAWTSATPTSARTSIGVNTISQSQWPYGDESDGAITHASTGNIASGLYQCTDFTVNSGVVMTITEAYDGYLVVLATGTITIAGEINGAGRGGRGGQHACSGSTRCNGSAGSSGTTFGGSGGGGGGATPTHESKIGGAGGSCSGYKTNSPTADTTANGGSGGNLSHGSAGEAIPTAAYDKLSSLGVNLANFQTFCSGAGGGSGGGEGNDKGIGGDGGAGIVFIAPTIDLQSGSTINISGASGGTATSSNSGGGGGGGGGTLILASETLTNAGTITQSGGSGGTATSVYDGGAGGAGRTLTITL